MSNIVEFASFNLKKESSVPDFLLVSEKFNKLFLSLQKGYISRKLLINDELWVDLIIWETMQDAQNAVNEFYKSDTAAEYMSFIEENSGEFRHFSIKKSY